MNKDGPVKVLTVAFLVCLVAGALVSTAAVTLRPLQDENRLLFRRINILQAAGLYLPGMDVGAAFAHIDRRFVEIETGAYVEMPVDYDQRSAARDPTLSRRLADDPAAIRRQARVAEVWLIRGEDGELEGLILPIHGYGMWAVIYGFLALEADLETVAGIGFYEHRETPGLGGEIDNPGWRRQWAGKRPFDEEGRVVIRVLKGRIGRDDPRFAQVVDGVSGATQTTDGLDRLVRFWLGGDGFGPYLDRLRQDRDADGRN